MTASPADDGVASGIAFASATRFNTPYGNQLGVAARGGSSHTFYAQDYSPAFRFTNLPSLATSDPVLYQCMSSLSFFTSANIRKNQLLRPYPHMTTLIGVRRASVRRYAQGSSVDDTSETCRVAAVHGPDGSRQDRSVRLRLTCLACNRDPRVLDDSSSFFRIRSATSSVTLGTTS